MMVSTEVRFFDRARKIQHGQERKDAGLHKGNQESEAEDRNRRDVGGKQREHEQKLMLGHHVAEEPECERHNACKMADDLNGQHERCKSPHRAHEMLDISKLMSLE